MARFKQILLFALTFVAFSVARSDETYFLYQIRHPGDLPSDPMLDKRAINAKLVLVTGGRFSYHLENHVMMTLIVDAQGTFQRSNGKLILKGEAKEYMDDGYRKSNSTDTLSYVYRVAGDALFQKLGEGEMVLLRKGGIPPQPVKLPARKASDRVALEAVGRLRRRYATLRSYSDDGTMTSRGEGFMAKNARFSTRFVRPRSFLFKVVSLDGDQEYDPQVVWADEQHAWLLWYDSGYSSLHEQSLSHSLSILISSGPETEIVPFLLLPKESPSSPFSGYDRFYEKGFQKLASESCQVIEMANQRGAKMDIWISKQSGLILKAWDPSAGATVSYKPRGNITISHKDVTFTPPRSQSPHSESTTTSPTG